MRIAICDDEQVALLRTKETLEKAYKSIDLIVDIYTSGNKLIEVSATYKYDLVILDIEMPLIDGIETHIFNNCILGDVFSYLIGEFSENVQEILVLGAQIVFFIIAVIVMIKQKKEVKEYFINNKEDKRKYRRLFLNVGMIAFMAIHFAMAIDGITKLK